MRGGVGVTEQEGEWRVSLLVGQSHNYRQSERKSVYLCSFSSL